MNKRFINIKEAAKILNLKEHVIRYWDSIDPKTQKIRIGGLSTKSKGGTRYFSKENLLRLEKLKNLMYDNGDPNYSLKLADKILSSRKINNTQNISNTEFLSNNEKVKKLNQILKKMRYLIH